MTRPRTENVILVAILLLAAALRLYGIGSQSLWFDEAASVRIVRQDFATMLRSIKDDERIPPLHYLILHGWVRVFGHAEGSVRLPSALAGVAAVWALYLMTRRLFGVAPALIGALLLAAAPFQIQYSQEARSYSLMLLLSLVSCWLFVRMFDEPGSRLDAGYVLAGAAALFSHLYALFTLIAQSVAYAVAWLRSESGLLLPRRWAVTQIGIAALFLAWAPIALRWARSVGAGFWLPPMTVYDLWAAYATQAGTALLAALLIALAVVGAWTVRRNVRGLALMVSLATLPVVVPVVVSILTKPAFTPRYGIVAPAALYVLAACGVIALRSRILQGVIVAALVGLSLHAIRLIPDKPDWRGAVAHAESIARAGDYIVMTPRRSTYIYDYYAARRDVTRKGFDSGAIPLSLPLDPGVRVWFIHPSSGYDPAEVLDRGDWRVRGRRDLRGLTVLEVDDGSSPLNAAPATLPHSSTR